MPDYTSGYTGAVNAGVDRNAANAAIAARLQAMQQAAFQQQLLQRQLGAQSQWGNVLNRAFPQLPAPPPGSMSPGGGNPALQQGTPQAPSPGGPPPAGPMPQAMPSGGGGMVPPPAATAPQAAPPPAAAPPQPLPPFRPLPSAQPAQPGPGAVPPPPAMPTRPQQGPSADATQFSVPNLVQMLRQSNVPPEQWGMMLDALPEPIKNNAALQLKMMDQENRMLRDWATVQYRQTQAEQRQQQITRQEQRDAELARAARERERMQQERNDQSERRLGTMISRIGGGSDALKTTEFIYPKDADGRPDMTKEPIGVRGVTKTGRIVMLDAQGNPTKSIAGGTAKEAAATRGGAGQQVRTKLVVGAANNALQRLDTIEKEFPDYNVSLLMQSHASSLPGAAAESLYRRTLSDKQLQADQAWRNLITEGIPALTGGLRGSDSFRSFLIQESPLSGTSANARKRGREFLRANIEGMRDIFQGKQPPKAMDKAWVSGMLSEYASKPEYWGAGVTKEQVESTINSAQKMLQGSKSEQVQGSGPGTPNETPANGGWKVETVQ